MNGKYLNAKVRCVDVGPHDYWYTAGKIYAVTDGVLTTNRDVSVFERKPVKTFDEINNRLSAQFELVEDDLYDGPQQPTIPPMPKTIPPRDKKPNYWQNITKINQKQEAKGVSKYGQNLEDNITLSTVQRIEHLQEELIDGLKYCEHIKQTANDSLTANDYQRMAMRTIGAYVDDDYKMLCNAVYGLNGEAGEVIDILKKHEFQGHELNKDKLIDEAGDVAWYLALLATALGVSLQDIMLHNVEKLKARYPDGFSKDRSVNREENNENNNN